MHRWPQSGGGVVEIGEEPLLNIQFKRLTGKMGRDHDPDHVAIAHGQHTVVRRQA